MVHDGVRNLLHQPEFGDVDRFSEVLDLLEEERVLGEMLAAIESDHGTRIMIGRETGLEQLRQCSLVMTTYRVGAQRWGTLGVLGPPNYFGEIGLLGHRPRTATVKAIAPCTLYRINGSDFVDAMTVATLSPTALGRAQARLARTHPSASLTLGEPTAD